MSINGREYAYMCIHTYSYTHRVYILYRINIYLKGMNKGEKEK